MRIRTSILLPLVALTLAACTSGSDKIERQLQSGSPAAAGDAIVLDRAGALTRVDAGSGSVVFDAEGAVSAADWSSIYATTFAGGRTTLHRLDATTGAADDVASFSGELTIWSVSDGGHLVALMAPFGDAGTDWEPPPRGTTDLMVADTLTGEKERFHLEGNYVPETFSTDGENLFMLSYDPPTHPTSYRVTSLYIEKGRVWDVIGPDKQPVENMTATRLQQVRAPDGKALYTLYVNQPPPSLRANGAATEDPGEVAFVHTLHLDGFAVCTALPDDFGDVPVGRSAIAVSPDGAFVYAVDAMHGDVATIATARDKVRNAKVDLSMLGGDRTASAVSADGATLFVGSGATIAAIDTATFALRATYAVNEELTDLRLSPDGTRLYVSSVDRVSVLDASTGGSLGSIAEGGDAIAWVEAA